MSTKRPKTGADLAGRPSRQVTIAARRAWMPNVAAGRARNSPKRVPTVHGGLQRALAGRNDKLTLACDVHACPTLLPYEHETPQNG